MKQLLLTLYILPLWNFVQNKAPKPIIKSKTVYCNKKLTYIELNDVRGNLIFLKSGGIDEPSTLITYSEFDSLNREIKTYSAQSDFGYSYHENIYRDNKIFHYNSLDDPAGRDSFSQEHLRQVRSSEDFLSLDGVKRLAGRKKRLVLINELDTAGNVVTEIYLSEKGDTTSINNFRYNDHNKNTYFHMGSVNDETWRYSVYYIYDNNLNQIKNFRVPDNAITDTTEVSNYTYGNHNQLLSENYYYNSKFGHRTDYYYNSKQQLVKELFYEGEESVVDAVTTYKYDSQGNLSKKTIVDNLKPKGSRKEVYRYAYTLW